MSKNEKSYLNAIDLIHAEMQRTGNSIATISCGTKIDAAVLRRSLNKDLHFDARTMAKVCEFLNLDLLFVVLRRDKNAQDCINPPDSGRVPRG